MVKSAILGFPRIGPNRELKKATESYWKDNISQSELIEVGKQLRLQNWSLQKKANVDIIPSNDFSFYDQILDTSLLFNVIPKRYSNLQLSELDTLFAMGRGLQKGNIDVTALEMVKWFDSNYHYVRPTFSNSTEFKLIGTKPIDEFIEAKENLGIITRPVILGPVSFLHLGKSDHDSLDLNPLSLLPKLLPVYLELLAKLKKIGAKEVQIDEPILVLDLDSNVKIAYKQFFDALSNDKSNLPEITLATYFGTVVPNSSVLENSNNAIDTLHFDFIRSPEQLNSVIDILSPNQKISVGIVDGRNIWKNDFTKSVSFINNVINKLNGNSDRVIVATSSSLLHTPVDLDTEKKLPSEVKDFFSFATQKVDEIVTITDLINNEKLSSSLNQLTKDKLTANVQSIKSRENSKITNNPIVQKRINSIDEKMSTRAAPFTTRLKVQKPIFNLPLLPTTTIGSFPQTKDIRINRNKFVKGTITQKEYETFINSEIEKVIRFQEEIDLDVLVHGEPERNDMVQYFGEQIDGYHFTTNGWVQSYGSRYVRPPIIVGDLSRPGPMSVRESVYAQSLTKKTVKGMLTGPITCLRWSFPRVDIDQETQALQLALVLRDEVLDLEKAGIKVIQVDEPALREGLPLRQGKERSEYLNWAAKAFRVATSGVENKTQIHSHFCYSDLDPVHIKALDADVVSIEFSKKDDPNYIKEFQTYPNHIGLGLFDIHSPRVPSKEEFIQKIGKILESYPAEKFWVNPDCGLKTRDWEETKQSLTNMVAAAKHYRSKY